MAKLSRQLVSPAPAGGTLAGLVLFGLVALPASLLVLAALYGLLAAHGELGAQVDWLTRVLPTEVALFLVTRLELSSVASSSSSSPSVAALGALATALVGAHAGVVASLRALDRAHRSDDARPFLHRNALAMLFTLAGIMLTIGGLIALVVLPRAADTMAWPARSWELLFLIRWPLAFAVVTSYLTLLYRVAPTRRTASPRSALLGALVGAGVWVFASVAMSWCAAGMSEHARLFGAVGVALVAVLWFHLSAIAVLLGGIVTARTR